MPMFRFLMFFFLVACSSSLFAEDSVEEKYPVFTVDKTVWCPECAKNEYKEIKAPFSVRLGRVKLVGAIFSEMDSLEFFYALSVSDNILESELNEIYVEHIRKMRASNLDSSYFTGTLKLNIWLKGEVSGESLWKRRQREIADSTTPFCNACEDGRSL